MGDLVDSADLAQLISATFVGMELTHSADPQVAADAFATIERLSELASTFNELGPVTRKAVRLALGRADQRASHGRER